MKEIFDIIDCRTNLGLRGRKDKQRFKSKEQGNIAIPEVQEHQKEQDQFGELDKSKEIERIGSIRLKHSEDYQVSKAKKTKRN